MKRRIVLSGGVLLAILANGCVVSRTAENLWAVGVVEYYADFSNIENEMVYESDGAYFIKVKTAAYRPDPALLGLFTPPLSHMIEHRTAVTADTPAVWLKITSEAKEYLCADAANVPDDNISDDFNFFSFAALAEAEVVPDMAECPLDAIPHAIVRPLPPIQIERFCCGDGVVHSQFLFKEKSLKSYGLCPLVVAGAVWDIPATVVMSAYFYLILAPNMFIAEAGRSLLGMDCE